MKNTILLFVIFSGIYLSAQESNNTLADLNQFQTQAGNWQIVGDVVIDPNIDVHDWEKIRESNLAIQAIKNKRKRAKAVQSPYPLIFKEGTGILLNSSSPTKKDHLITKWEHGDIILELEVMVPKGSNSGIYLQGRYEVQINDSWGVQQPKYSDIGGIYRNWEEEPAKILKGVAPSSNAAKAPGLWQQLKIHFQAPKFNTAGDKIANAKFVKVELNGVPIHNNVEVPLPTGGPISKEEVAMGPLMIQGDHGPIAIKNLSYTALKESSAYVSSLNYKVFLGEFKGLEELEGQAIHHEGTSEKIDVAVTGEEDNYGIIYSGTLQIPEAGDYTIITSYSGGVELQLDDKTIIRSNESGNLRSLEHSQYLNAGKHNFTLTNIKSAGWRAPRLGLGIKALSTELKIFNAFRSNPPNISNVSPIYVDVGATPRMLRGFVSFQGDSTRLSHTIGVGTPNGLHYVYDLGAGNMVGAWRGDFVDATPMWHNRGNGSFKPRGATLWTFLNQPIAQLKDSLGVFPETGQRPDFISKGYSIDPESGLPIFKHTYREITVSNKICPIGTTHFINEIGFSKNGLSNWYCKLASGETRKMPDGSYAIGDQRYYIKILSGQTPFVRTVNGETELVVKVDGTNIKYEIIW